MISSRNVITVAICCLAVLHCTIVVEGQNRRFFPQWARNTHNNNEDSAQDPNNVDDRFGWSWGVAHHSNRRNPQFGGFNSGGGGNSFNGGNSYEDDYYNGPGSFGNGNSFNNGPGNSFNGNGRFPSSGFGNNGFGNNFDNFNNNNVGGFNNPGSSGQQQQQPTTTTQAPAARTPPPTTVATPAAAPQDGNVSATMVVYSDEFYECMAQCRTTNEWNPVCGSDMHDYNNVNKLNCANQCGANVQQVRRGPCRPAGK